MYPSRSKSLYLFFGFFVSSLANVTVFALQLATDLVLEPTEVNRHVAFQAIWNTKSVGTYVSRFWRLETLHILLYLQTFFSLIPCCLPPILDGSHSWDISSCTASAACQRNWIQCCLGSKSLGWVQYSPVDCLPRGNYLYQLDGIVPHSMLRVPNDEAAQAWRHGVAVFCMRYALSCKHYLSVVLCMEQLDAMMTIAGVWFDKSYGTIVWLSITQLTRSLYVIGTHFPLPLVKHDTLKMVCKHDGPSTTLVVSVDPAGMSAFTRIAQY